MAAFKTIVDGAYLVPLGGVNAVLLDHEGELTLIDTGFPNSGAKILRAVTELNRSPRDVKHLVLTHGHPDHIGSAAAIVRATGARTYIHPADAPLAETGGPFRPMRPARALPLKLLYHLIWRPEQGVEPVAIDQRIEEGEALPIAGGLRPIHAPGHCAGQLAFLWQGRRLLIAADVFTDLLGLADPIGFEDEAQGRRSQRKLADLDFDAAAFGHGKAIREGASAKLRRAVARQGNS